jgi:hypothetical protein
MRTKKYKTNYAISKISKHNLRDPKSVIKGQLANPKFPNEYEGAATSKELFTQIKSRIKTCTSKPRPDANKIVEVLITATDTFFNSNDKSVHDAYFMKAKEWIEKHYGKENVLQTAIHYDEKTPHMHVLIVPIKTELDKKTGKEISKLNAKAFFDGPKCGIALQDDFYETVGKPFDLDRGISKSITGAQHVSTDEFWRNIGDHLAASAANELTSTIEKQRYEQLAIDAAAMKLEVENAMSNYDFKMKLLARDIKDHETKKQNLIDREKKLDENQKRIDGLEKGFIDRERSISRTEKDIQAIKDDLAKKQKEMETKLDNIKYAEDMAQRLHGSLTPEERAKYMEVNEGMDYIDAYPQLFNSPEPTEQQYESYGLGSS